MFDQVDFMKDFISSNIIPDDKCRVLISAYQDGHIEALELIIKGFSRMIISFIPVGQRNNEVASDKYQNGVIGLIRAVEEFDLNSLSKFSSYAYISIKRAIARTNTKLLSLPIEHWKLTKALETLLNESSVELTKLEICDKLNISNTVFDTLIRTTKFSYLQDIDDSDAYQIKSSDDILETVMKKVDGELLIHEIETLKDEKVRHIIKLHFGFNCEPMTFQAIGNMYGFSRQRAQVLFKAGLLDLGKNKVVKELAKEYL